MFMYTLPSVVDLIGGWFCLLNTCIACEFCVFVSCWLNLIVLVVTHWLVLLMLFAY